MRLLRHPLFLAVALSHFSVDMLNGQTGILLAVLSRPLGMTNAIVGLVATAYALIGAMAQPLFGWWSDRYGGRWATAGGVIWMATFFSLLAIAPGPWAILFLLLATVGSGAFHPAGAMNAARLGQVHMAGQAATAASIFFLFGQGGLAVGPALGGAVIDHLGRAGLLTLTALAFLVGLLAAYQLRPSVPTPTRPERERNSPPVVSRPEAGSRILVLVMLISGFRVWGQMATTTFLPKYLHDLGVAPTVYGLVTAMYMGGAGIGGVVGAMLGDRWGARPVIAAAMTLSIAPFYYLPLAGGAALYPAALLTGFLSGAPFSILVTLAQRSLPNRAALAAGIILGSMFAAGAFGAYLTGLAADHFGLARALQGNALLALSAAVLSLRLRPDGDVVRAAVVPSGD